MIAPSWQTLTLGDIDDNFERIRINQEEQVFYLGPAGYLLPKLDNSEITQINIIENEGRIIFNDEDKIPMINIGGIFKEILTA